MVDKDKRRVVGFVPGIHNIGDIDQKTFDRIEEAESDISFVPRKIDVKDTLEASEYSIPEPLGRLFSGRIQTLIDRLVEEGEEVRLSDLIGRMHVQVDELPQVNSRDTLREIVPLVAIDSMPVVEDASGRETVMRHALAYQFHISEKEKRTASK